MAQVWQQAYAMVMEYVNSRPEGHEITLSRKDRKSLEATYNGEQIISRAAQDFNMSPDEIIRMANIGDDLSRVEALAVFQHNGDMYVDVNPTAWQSVRGDSQVQPMPSPEQQQKGLTAINNTPERAHAEVGTMYQSYCHGGDGGDATLNNYGKPICSFCKTDIKNVAGFTLNFYDGA